METGGIIRRVDELGRIVIPKEIRKTYRLHEGSTLEINILKSGEIVLSKYSKISSIYEFANIICESLSRVLEFNVLICDTEKIVASNKKTLNNKLLNENIIKNFFNRKNYILQKSVSMMMSIYSNDTSIYTSQAIIPIICEGDVVGGIILYSLNEKEITTNDLKCCQVFSNFLGEVWKKMPAETFLLVHQYLPLQVY